jgi:serine/threonine-protein phosphatase 6 regulatory ankyrin repeat subunit B
MDCSKPLANRTINICEDGHINLALEFLFSLDKLNQLLGVECTSYKERTKEFLKSGDAYLFGFITESTDGKPLFIHRCFAEYFAAKWFTKNFSKCQSFILDNFFEPSFEVIRYIFDRMLAEEFKLHDAILNNDLEAVSKLLKEETDVNILDNGGRTALHLAACYNSITTKALLSVQDVDTKITDEVLKWTPLRYADRTRSWMAMDSLLQSGGNADDIVFTRSRMYDCKWGQAALRASARRGYKNLLEFMLNSGFDINASVHISVSPKYFNLFETASMCSQEDVVRFLIERGFNINRRSSNSDTALHFAAKTNSESIINLLLDKGASVNLRDAYGRTPLHEAATSWNLIGTKVLVNRGAALEETDKMGRTPLMLAASICRLEIVRYLVQNGADINACNATESALHLAISRGLFDMTCFLLEKGADINGSNVERGNSPLHCAILHNRIIIAEKLIQRGADVNLCTRDGRNMSALHLAAYCVFQENFEFLIDAGAKLNEQDGIGYTPLHWAVANNNTELALLLLEKGADANITDFKRRTPLYLAVVTNNILVCNKLCEFWC